MMIQRDMKHKLTTQEKAYWRKRLENRDLQPYDRRYKCNRDQQHFEEHDIIFVDDIELAEKQANDDHKKRTPDYDKDVWGESDWLLDAFYKGCEPIEKHNNCENEIDENKQVCQI